MKSDIIVADENDQRYLTKNIFDHHNFLQYDIAVTIDKIIK